MAEPEAIAKEQKEMWNGPGACAWIEAQQVLDQLMTPFERILTESVTSTGARSVLDVGCGTGATTLAAARAMGGKGQAVGVDISEPMIQVAKGRAKRENVPAKFINADAQTYAFDPDSFDLMISRFGVMFFSDFVQAFANLRRAMKRGGGTRCIVWRSPAENPFMTAAERAAAPLLPDLPPRDPNAPGQFAFADSGRVSSILKASGWDGIDIQPLDVACSLSVADLNNFITRMGPIGRILQEVDEQTRTRVTEAVRAAFVPFIHGTEARFTAACWMVIARNPG